MVWMWYVAHGAGFIQDGLLGQVKHQLCPPPVGYVDSKVITIAVFLLAFAKSPGGGGSIGAQPWTWSCSGSGCLQRLGWVGKYICKP